MCLIPGDSGIKNLPVKVGDPGSIPELGRSPREGKGDPLRCSCLENPRDREAWWAAVHRVAESQTPHTHTHTHTHTVKETRTLGHFARVSAAKKYRETIRD